MMTESENLNNLWLRWALANSVGFTLGWSGFGIIGHGLTGDHGDALSVAQFAAHTLGLLVAAAVIAAFQLRALKRFGGAAPWYFPTTLAVLPAAFWTGYYSAGIPFDLLLAFTATGVIGGLALRQLFAGGSGWVWVNSLSFPAGFGVTAAVTYPIADVLQGAFGGGLAGHVCLFTTIGVVGGASSGLFSGLALAALSRRLQHN